MHFLLDKHKRCVLFFTIIGITKKSNFLLYKLHIKSIIVDIIQKDAQPN